MHAHTLKALACLHCSPVLVSLIYFQPSFSDSDHRVPFTFYVHLLSSLYLCNSSRYLSHTENSGSSDRKCDVEGKEEEMKRKIGGKKYHGRKVLEEYWRKKMKKREWRINGWEEAGWSNKGVKENMDVKVIHTWRNWNRYWQRRQWEQEGFTADGHERERQWEREREQERKRSWR